MLNKRLSLFFDSVFLVFFTLSLVVVAARPEIYSRPVAYFVLTCLTTGVIVAEILMFPEGRTRIFSSLGKILLVSASLRLVPQLLYPGLIGIDPWWHQSFTSDLLNSGRIPLGTGYSELPVFHLIVASTSALTGLDYKMSVMTSIGFFSIVSLVFVFLIGKRVSTVRVGLLAALIAGMATWNINAGFWIIPNTLGAVLILLIIYLQFRQDYKLSFKLLLLSVIVSIALIMTHTLSSLAMAIVLGAFPISQLIARKKSRYSRENMKLQLAFFALFSTAMLAYWTFVSGHIRNVINALQHGFRFERLLAPSTVTSFRNTHFLEFLGGSAGIFLFYIVSLLGLVYSVRKMRKQFIALAFAGVFVTFPAFLGYAFSLSALYPQRWFLYSEPIMAILAAFGLLSLSKLGKSRKTRTLLVTLTLLTVIVLSFFATTNPVSDIDTSAYTPNFTVRFFFYSSEMDASVFLQNLRVEKFYTDTNYKSMLYSRTTQNHIISFSSEVIYQNFSDMNAIVVRQIVAEAPFYVPGYLGAYRFNYDIRSSLALNFSRVYDSGTVWLYTRSDATVGR